MLQFIQMALSRQRWLVSSCAQQTPWWKFQGTVDGHIPLPKRRYQQVCYWQPMDRQSHPIIKRTFSKIHNYWCPLTPQKEFRVRWDWGAKVQHKITRNQTIYVSAFCGSLFRQLKCFYNMALIKWYVGTVSEFEGKPFQFSATVYVKINCGSNY